MVHKKHKHALMGFFCVVIAICGVYAYFLYCEYYPSTDDAYVGASIVNVAPKIGGYLVKLNVSNNQLVHKGDVLFKINPADYSYNFDQAQKNYDSSLAQLAMAEQQLDVQKSTFNKSKVQYDLALEIVNRYKELYATHTLSKQAYDNAVTNLKLTRSQLDIEDKRLSQTQTAVKLMEAKRDSAKSVMNLAKSNLDYTEYHSPSDGYISNLVNLSNGEYISPSQQMFGIIDVNNWWVDANFKETQISKIKPGQKVQVSLDMYEHKYNGIVQSISYSSGSTFSLLPSQNATGNWVKVTQRFGVRIKLENDPRFPLRVGASAQVKINTRELQ